MFTFVVRNTDIMANISFKLYSLIKKFDTTSEVWEIMQFLLLLHIADTDHRHGPHGNGWPSLFLLLLLFNLVNIHKFLNKTGL